MRFERLVDDGRLWSVIYDGDSANAFNQVFSQWNDFEWLTSFFKENADDLNHYFHITDVDAAIYDTVEEVWYNHTYYDNHAETINWKD